MFVSWVFVTLVYVYGSTNITVNTDKLDQQVLVTQNYDELLRGEIIKGGFVAGEDYLGQISVRFYNYDRINGDEVRFRLKEKNGPLIYENTYKTDQFQPNELFPFGFPVITSSRGKEYQFEVESMKGRYDDSVTLSRGQPVVTVTFQYPKKLLLKDPFVLLAFLGGKVSSVQMSADLLVSVVTYITTISLVMLLIFLFLAHGKIRQVGIRELLLSLVIILFFASAMAYYLKVGVLSESLSICSYFLLSLLVVAYLLDRRRKDL